MKNLLFVFGISAIVIACAPKSTEGVIENEVDGNMPKTAIAEGKLIYIKKCSKCHDAKIVEDFTTEQWAKILPVMTDKAKLTDTETHQITEYIHWELEN